MPQKAIVDDDGARDLGLQVQQDGKDATVRVNGALHGSTAAEFLWACRSLYERGARDVVIDLTDTIFLDSSGLHALVLVRGLFGEDDGTLQLAHPIEPILRILEISGLAEAIGIAEPAEPDDREDREDRER